LQLLFQFKDHPQKCSKIWVSNMQASTPWLVCHPMNAPHWFSHFWGHPMNESTSILEPFSCNIHRWWCGCGCQAHPFSKALIVGHFLTDQISLQDCGSIVRQGVFFLFLGWISATLWQKIGYDSYKWFLWQKKVTKWPFFEGKKEEKEIAVFSELVAIVLQNKNIPGFLNLFVYLPLWPLVKIS
jgi:hypothetical protein